MSCWCMSGPGIVSHVRIVNQLPETHESAHHDLGTRTLLRHLPCRRLRPHSVQVPHQIVGTQMVEDPSSRQRLARANFPPLQCLR